MKRVAVGLAALAVLVCLSNAQPRTVLGGGQEPDQTKQILEPEITWKYPVDPTLTPVAVVAEVVSEPEVVVSVAVECQNNNAHVEVKRDFFGTGNLIDASEITLGDCTNTGEDERAQVLIFDTQLEGCDSSLATTEDALIYTFHLKYDPKSVSTVGVVRGIATFVKVECHYPRKRNVSSDPLNPHWVPFSATKMVEELLYFSLRIMTEDFQFARSTNRYYLGDPISIQATVQQYFHVPLRVFVQTCVATVSPDATSTPRYAFIDNRGCMVDAAITGSSSRFMPRTADDKLNFKVDSFRFQNNIDIDTVYITCHLTATSIAHPIDSENRACSYLSGWKEASGSRQDSACASCSEGIEIGGGGGVSGGRRPHTPTSGGGAGSSGGGHSGVTAGGTTDGSYTSSATGGSTGSSFSSGFSGGFGGHSSGSTGGSHPGSTGGTTGTSHTSSSTGGTGYSSTGTSYTSSSTTTTSFGSFGGDTSFPGSTGTGGFGGTGAFSGTTGRYSTGVRGGTTGTFGGGSGGGGGRGGTTGTFGGGGGGGGGVSFSSSTTGTRYGGSGGLGGGTGGKKKRTRREIKQQKQEEPIIWQGYVGLGPIKIQERREVKA